MEISGWVAIGLVVLGAIAGFLDVLAEETDEKTPVVGKYHGLMRPLARAILRVLPGRKPDAGV